MLLWERTVSFQVDWDEKMLLKTTVMKPSFLLLLSAVAGSIQMKKWNRGPFYMDQVASESRLRLE